MAHRRVPWIDDLGGPVDTAVGKSQMEPSTLRTSVASHLFNGRMESSGHHVPRPARSRSCKLGPGACPLLKSVLRKGKKEVR